MIFVTVGTHEQQFNRLVKYMDLWAKGHDEKVVVQIGFSTYEPKYCKWRKLFAYKEMEKLVNNARIVITHGGPSSFIAPLQIGKTPIVVPRKKEFDEHVNDHQVHFCQAVEERMGTIIVVEDVQKLGGIIDGYEQIHRKNGNESNNAKFNEEFGRIVDGMFAVKQR